MTLESRTATGRFHDFSERHDLQLTQKLKYRPGILRPARLGQNRAKGSKIWFFSIRQASSRAFIAGGVVARLGR
ncbi:MAG: hypothetical protein DWI25_01525 [Planctomycetota bacterium]|nr:MAG: hypothetical protein DWI25_01525 [Planctomycetota bacterium]